MRYYIIAGEASGDLHASNLIRGLRAEDPEADIRGWGGDLMREAGAEIVRHYKDTAIMGFLTVLKNLGKIKANIRLCCEDIRSWKPDVVILVDYAGFNLRIARFAKGIGLKVFYYISPKLWAWNTGRVKKIKRYVDRMYTIFPFETDFYGRYHYTVEYGGNPLVDRRGSFDVGCRLCSLPEGTGGPYFVWADLSFVESGESGSGYLGYGDPGNGFTAYSPSGLLQW